MHGFISGPNTFKRLLGQCKVVAEEDGGENDLRLLSLCIQLVRGEMQIELSYIVWSFVIREEITTGLKRREME